VLALVAGAPAIVGAWIGGFLTSDFLGVVFFAVAAERLSRSSSRSCGTSLDVHTADSARATQPPGSSPGWP